MRLAAGLVTVTLLTMLGCTATPDDEPPASPGPSPTPTAEDERVELTFGVYGEPEEIDAFRSIADTFTSISDNASVEVVEWPDEQAAIDDINDASSERPDVFLVSRRDLSTLLADEAILPVGDLLDSRGVDFGDGYARTAIEAFSDDNALQCMPYSLSPVVMFVNTELVDTEAMALRELPVPSRADRFSFEQFVAAANYVTRPRARPRVKAVHVEPTLRGLAPFVYSGGGEIFDDADDPTSLDLSSDESRAALEQTLAVLRNPRLTLSERQLARRTPQEWFERGRLAMLAGTREMVPELRVNGALSFDVRSMPIIDSPATLGAIDGLCMSADTASADAAADFLTYAISDIAVERVARLGHMVPANNAIAGSEVFLQPGRQPASAAVFNAVVRGMVVPPLLDSWEPLQEAVGPQVEAMLTQPILDLDLATEEIDEDSRAVLDPDYEPSESP